MDAAARERLVSNVVGHLRNGVSKRHDLHLQRPTRVLATLDRVVQIALVVVAADAYVPSR